MPLHTSHAHALLFLLAGSEGPHVTQQALGEALCIDKSNVARLCEKLQRLDHITQGPSPTDGRARLLALTARGRRVAQEVDRASRERFAGLLAAVPAAQRAPLLASLEALNLAIITVHEKTCDPKCAP